jgi:Cdc6-like AAA superfamily ATPase
MNLENIGLSIAKIINKNSKIDKIISVEDDKSKVNNYFEEYKCKNGEHIQLIPTKERERNVRFITGQSGSGKSTSARKYIEEYHKLYKKRPIYLFSYFDSDKSLDACKYIKRIKLDDSFVNTSFHVSDFQDSLIIFDDIDCIKNKALKNKLVHILGSLLELGRHHNVEVIYCSHVATKGNETQCILNETTCLTIYPKVMSSRSLKYLLESYFGLDKSQIRKIKMLNSRAVSIVKTYPNIIIYEGGAYVLKTD